MNMNLNLMKMILNIALTKHSLGSLFVIFLLIFQSHESQHENQQGCILHANTPKSEQALLKRLAPLYGKTLESIEYNAKGKEEFVYKIGICANPDPTFANSGAVQYNFSNKSEKYSLGRFNNTEIIAGTNWLLLTYFDGDDYKNKCNNASRMANIMIVCDPETTGKELRVIGETLAMESPHCFYWFEFGSSLACAEKEDKLSSGSIFCILVFTGFGFYLILGFFYRRFVVGAQGLEQIPNYSFWKDFGNLQADGCDFVCRCGGRREQNAYRGINENIPRNEDRDRDDQLLTM